MRGDLTGGIAQLSADAGERTAAPPVWTVLAGEIKAGRVGLETLCWAVRGGHVDINHASLAWREAYPAPPGWEPVCIVPDRIVFAPLVREPRPVRMVRAGGMVGEYAELTRKIAERFEGYLERVEPGDSMTALARRLGISVSSVTRFANSNPEWRQRFEDLAGVAFARAGKR